jgi:WD40 repeat protein
MKRMLVINVLMTILVACQPVGTVTSTVSSPLPPTITATHAQTTPNATEPITLTSLAPDCQAVTFSAPEPSQFKPIKASGAIAYSGDGLTLIFPDTGALASIHSLVTLGLQGYDRGFVWSPDGEKIVFLHSVHGPPLECLYGYVLLADLAMGEVRTLTATAGIYSHPAWSPDGQRVAISDETGTVRVIHVESGDTVVLAANAARSLPVTWLDNEHLAYLRAGALDSVHADLVSQPMDGSNPITLVPDLPTRAGAFAISPDGKSLAYLRGALILRDLQSGMENNLGAEPALEELLQWSPNGQYLLGRGGLTGMYLITPDSTSKIRQLGPAGIPGRIQPWAPDSQRFVLMAGDEQAPSRIGFFDLDTGAIQELGVELHPPFELAWNTR